jgi:hypothetical protein
VEAFRESRVALWIGRQKFGGDYSKMHAQSIQGQQIPGGIILKLSDQLTTISKFEFTFMSLLVRVCDGTERNVPFESTPVISLSKWNNMADSR